MELLDKAIEARKFCYCKYSGYAVSCAVLTETDKIFTGVNIENASYGLCMCAERVALFKAISEGEIIKEMVLVTDNGATPCGACRQVMYELMPHDVRIKLYTPEKKLMLITDLRELFPYGFKLT